MASREAARRLLPSPRTELCVLLLSWSVLLPQPRRCTPSEVPRYRSRASPACGRFCRRYLETKRAARWRWHTSCSSLEAAATGNHQRENKRWRTKKTNVSHNRRKTRCKAGINRGSGSRAATKIRLGTTLHPGRSRAARRRHRVSPNGAVQPINASIASGCVVHAFVVHRREHFLLWLGRTRCYSSSNGRHANHHSVRGPYGEAG